MKISRSTNRPSGSPVASSTLGSQGCESWEHIDADTPAPAARAGAITCADHAHEEAEYRGVLAELTPVEAAMKKRSGEHPRSIGDRAEAAVGNFLAHRAEQRGIRITRVFQNQAGRVQRELDRAAPLDDRVGNWDAGNRTIGETTALALHVEVTRERYSKKKFLGDVRKLLHSARKAVADGAPGLPFTVFVALGTGWKADTMMSLLHDELHAGVRTELLGGCEWWPLIDVFVVPQAVLKKHELMLLDDPKSLWPAYQHLATANDSLVRGLVLARTFLEHRLDQLLKLRAMDSDAFEYGSTLAEFGPRSIAVDAAAASRSAFLMRDPRVEHQRFAFDGWSRRRGLTVPETVTLDRSCRCAHGMPYVGRFGAG